MRNYEEISKHGCPNAQGNKPTMWRIYDDGREECQCWWCHALKNPDCKCWLCVSQRTKDRANKK